MPCDELDFLRDLSFPHDLHGCISREELISGIEILGPFQMTSELMLVSHVEQSQISLNINCSGIVILPLWYSKHDSHHVPFVLFQSFD
jgi:hypothetical protein